MNGYPDTLIKFAFHLGKNTPRGQTGWPWPIRQGGVNPPTAAVQQGYGPQLAPKSGV